ncbi:MAG: helix-turn-helix domain-containing protein [Alphaproteobacteria bacterium]
MQQECSTATVAPTERLDYWREIICGAFVDLRLQPQQNRIFDGSFSARALGGLLLARVEADSHGVVRSKRSNADCFLVGFHVAGDGIYSQGGRTSHVRPGEMSILDGTRPFEIFFPARFTTLTLKIPYSALHARLRDPDAVTASPLLDQYGINRLVGAYLQNLSREVFTARVDVREAVADNLCELIAIAGNQAQVDGKHGAPGSVLFEAMLRHIDFNLADPDLSPRAAAEHFGISVRYVHKLFEPSGTTFNQLLLDRRLQRCFEDLARATPRRKIISTIAYNWGFNDLSYFGRAFRRKFGCVPSDCLNLPGRSGVAH